MKDSVPGLAAVSSSLSSLSYIAQRAETIKKVIENPMSLIPTDILGNVPVVDAIKNVMPSVDLAGLFPTGKKDIDSEKAEDSLPESGPLSEDQPIGGEAIEKLPKSEAIEPEKSAPNPSKTMPDSTEPQKFDRNLPSTQPNLPEQSPQPPQSIGNRPDFGQPVRSPTFIENQPAGSPLTRRNTFDVPRNGNYLNGWYAAYNPMSIFRGITNTVSGAYGRVSSDIKARMEEQNAGYPYRVRNY